MLTSRALCCFLLFDITCRENVISTLGEENGGFDWILLFGYVQPTFLVKQKVS